MSIVIVDGLSYSAAVVDRAGRRSVTIASPLVAVGTVVYLDGVAHTVIAARDPFDLAPAAPSVAGGAFMNADARRRAESKALSAGEARTSKARSQMGKFCELELAHGPV